MEILSSRKSQGPPNQNLLAGHETCPNFDRMSKWKPLLIVLILLQACATHKAGIRAHSQLRFLGEYSLPDGLNFQGTTVGGLSGIDYDPQNQLYYLICDDGSKINPARYYTAHIVLGNKGIDSVRLLSVNSLLQPDGRVYPHTGVDPEALRYYPPTGQLFWSSEGERTLRKEGARLIDPFVHMAGRDGHYIDSFSLPANMHMQLAEKGPRNNGSFEGIAFADQYRTMYVSVEEPLYEDGPRAGLGDSTAWIRMIKFDVATKKPVAQYAYRIDAVAHAPQPANGFKINGISDILGWDRNRLLVIERSFSTGFPNNTIKLYIADLAGASDVSSLPSLERKNMHPVRKHLLFNMEDLGRYIDNIEGVTLGPILPDGHQSLVFVADNNFSSTQKNQFLLFEIE